MLYQVRVAFPHTKHHFLIPFPTVFHQGKVFPRPPICGRVDWVALRGFFFRVFPSLAMWVCPCPSWASWILKREGSGAKYPIYSTYLCHFYSFGRGFVRRHEIPSYLFSPELAFPSSFVTHLGRQETLRIHNSHWLSSSRFPDFKTIYLKPETEQQKEATGGFFWFQQIQDFCPAPKTGGC